MVLKVRGFEGNDSPPSAKTYRKAPPLTFGYIGTLKSEIKWGYSNLSRFSLTDLFEDAHYCYRDKFRH